MRNTFCTHPPAILLNRLDDKTFLIISSISLHLSSFQCDTLIVRIIFLIFIPRKIVTSPSFSQTAVGYSRKMGSLIFFFSSRLCDVFNASRVIIFFFILHKKPLVIVFTESARYIFNSYCEGNFWTCAPTCRRHFGLGVFESCLAISGSTKWRLQVDRSDAFMTLLPNEIHEPTSQSAV